MLLVFKYLWRESFGGVEGQQGARLKEIALCFSTPHG